MIQRIQTLILLLVIILMGSLVYAPMWIKISEGGDVYIFKFYFLKHLTGTGDIIDMETMPYSILMIAASLVAFLSLVEILLFKNRILQIKIGILNNFILISMLCFSAYVSVKLSKMIGKIEFSDFRFGFLIIIFSIMSNSRASYYIKKDEKLVRSEDRLR